MNVAYTAPPLRLKKRGLGELDVILVWGPLMIAGTYYSAVGRVPWQVWPASIPYGLLCTAVLMGKHIDKLPWDQAAGVRTLPVILGEARARIVTEALMVAFYIAVVACVSPARCRGRRSRALAGCRYYCEPQGASPAAARAAAGRLPGLAPVVRGVRFTHTRRAGALLVGGLAVATIFAIGPAWLR